MVRRLDDGDLWRQLSLGLKEAKTAQKSELEDRIEHLELAQAKLASIKKAFIEQAVRLSSTDFQKISSGIIKLETDIKIASGEQTKGRRTLVGALSYAFEKHIAIPRANHAPDIAAVKHLSEVDEILDQQEFQPKGDLKEQREKLGRVSDLLKEIKEKKIQSPIVKERIALQKARLTALEAALDLTEQLQKPVLHLNMLNLPNKSFQELGDLKKAIFFKRMERGVPYLEMARLAQIEGEVDRVYVARMVPLEQFQSELPADSFENLKKGVEDPRFKDLFQGKLAGVHEEPKGLVELGGLLAFAKAAGVDVGADSLSVVLSRDQLKEVQKGEVKGWSFLINEVEQDPVGKEMLISQAFKSLPKELLPSLKAELPPADPDGMSQRLMTLMKSGQLTGGWEEVKGFLEHFRDIPTHGLNPEFRNFVKQAIEMGGDSNEKLRDLESLMGRSTGFLKELIKEHIDHFPLREWNRVGLESLMTEKVDQPLTNGEELLRYLSYPRNFFIPEKIVAELVNSEGKLSAESSRALLKMTGQLLLEPVPRRVLASKLFALLQEKSSEETRGEVNRAIIDFRMGLFLDWSEVSGRARERMTAALKTSLEGFDVGKEIFPVASQEKYRNHWLLKEALPLVGRPLEQPLKEEEALAASSDVSLVNQLLNELHRPDLPEVSRKEVSKALSQAELFIEHEKSLSALLTSLQRTSTKRQVVQAKMAFDRGIKSELVLKKKVDEEALMASIDKDIEMIRAMPQKKGISAFTEGAFTFAAGLLGWKGIEKYVNGELQNPPSPKVFEKAINDLIEKGSVEERRSLQEGLETLVKHPLYGNSAKTALARLLLSPNI